MGTLSLYHSLRANTLNKFLDFRHFKSDLLGGITAGIVALPLALAFGEQSGLGASAGLYGAAFIAFFASLFGGTATQISGPTAPMTALSMLVIGGILQAFENQVEKALPVILSVFLIAGLLQIVMGFFKLGTFIKFIPYTVVSGFMSGIGVIILLTQLLPALGYYAGDDPKVVQKFMPQAEELILERILKEEAEDGILVLEEFKGTIERSEQISQADILSEATLLAQNDAKSVIGSIKYLPNAVSNFNYVELLLALITIVVIYGFKKITRAVPSTLVALLLVSGGAYLLDFEYVQIREIASGIPIMYLEIFTEFDPTAISPYLASAVLLALLGAIDSLLTSVVADNLTRTRHDPNRELIGQGIGNGIASLFGGLPGAGATIRTVVNIQAGGKTKISGMIAGILLFVILLLLGPIASQIPAAVLAGILLTVGIGVMDYKGLRALKRISWPEKFILLTVLVLTVFWQLIYAVGVGLIMAAFVFVKRMSDNSSDLSKITDLSESRDDDPGWDDQKDIPKEIRDKVFVKYLSGPLFFGYVSDFRALVATIPQIHLLVIRMEEVTFMDLSGFFALESAIEDLHKSGVVIALSEPNAQVKAKFSRMGVIPNLLPERLVFDDFSDCREWLREVLETEGGLEKELEALKDRL